MDFRFLIESSIIAGLSTILTVFIIIIDAIVNNYGEVSIDINKNKKILKVKGGSPLLTVLAEKNIFIPSACGGRGTCGACKLIVTSDIGPIYPTELPFMDKAELETNTRLSCQIKIKKNISIEIPDELFSIKKLKASIEKIADVTYDIKEITFKLPGSEEIGFKSGQYVQIEVPPYEKIKEPTQRAYSISTPPSIKNNIQLLIRYVPGGILTSYIFKYLKEGMEIDVIGPMGEFYVRDTSAAMICVAGGSGMAPIKSIIEDMIDNNRQDREIWYFFGARSTKDQFYLEKLKSYEKKLPNFHYIPALSEPEADAGWDGETGLITAVLDKYFKTKINKDLEKEGYLCGSPGMIDACIAVMKNNGITQDKIYYDKF